MTSYKLFPCFRDSKMAAFTHNAYQEIDACLQTVNKKQNVKLVTEGSQKKKKAREKTIHVSISITNGSSVSGGCSESEKEITA